MTDKEIMIELQDLAAQIVELRKMVRQLQREIQELKAQKEE